MNIAFITVISNLAKKTSTMNIEEFREYCLSVKGATESFPFIDRSILVFKVMDKMFAYINIEPKDGIFGANMKCNADKSSDLRDQYEGISRGVHTKSLTWNTVRLDSDIPDQLIKELVNHSVDEVLKTLSKKKQEEYSKS